MSSSTSSADEIIKKCHDVGEKLQAESKNVNTAGHHHTNTSNHPVHYLHELPLAAEQRYETLFNQLDRNGNKNRYENTTSCCLEIRAIKTKARY